MSSYVAAVADAVADAINAGIGSSAEFTAERVYVPEGDYKDFTGQSCKVFPPAVERTRSNRAAVRKDIELAIVYAVKLEPTTDLTSADGNDDIDPLMDIAEQIADAIALGGPYAGSPCIRVEADPIYDFEILRSHRVFVTRLRAFLMRS